MPSSGWTADWVGGANALRGSVDIGSAVLTAQGEKITSLTLYASTAGTMAWAVEGNRVHDSVLDPGYSTQIDLRTVYVAYDLNHLISADTGTYASAVVYYVPLA